MRSREEIDLENLALAAELARQLCHEFSNFLYTVFLQIEIAQASPAASQAEKWDAIKRDGQKVTRLLREWDDFHGRFSYAETTVDLHHVIRQMAGEAAAQNRTVQLAPSISKGSLPVQGNSVDTRHLLRLAVEDLFREGEEASAGVPSVTIETDASAANAVVRLAAEGTFENDNDLREARPRSLMAGACKSLAVRLGATVQRERSAGRSTIRLEFQCEPPA